MTFLVSPRYSAAGTTDTPALASVKRRIERGFNCLLIAGFFFGLAVPFLGLFQDNVAEKIAWSEGRPAAEFPELETKTSGVLPRPSTASIKAFPKQFERWLNDRIGFRKQLIQVYQVARYYGWTPGLLSKSGKGVAAAGVMGHLSQGSAGMAGQDRVLIGRDGWLFYHTDKVISDYRGTDLFTETELARWKQVLTERRDWLAKRGIKYLFVLTPNKHSVYSEYMPRSVSRVSSESRLKQLTEYMERESDVPVLNLLEPLLRAKSEHRVFHKADTHWNAFGAFVGAQEILKPLQSWFPAIEIPTLDDYEIVKQECDVSNATNVSPWIKLDLAVMQASPIPHREQVIDLVPRRAELSVPVQLPGVPESKGDLVQNQTSTHGRISRVYIVHDSYMMALAPFLAPHFREVTYHWKTDFPAEAIEKNRPVLVIQQLVERRLMDVEPTNPRAITDELRSMRSKQPN